MKRILLPLALAALAAAACAPAPSNNANTNANTNMSNMNVSNANSASSGSYTDSDIIAKEREVYDAFKKKDSNAFAALLADDFVYFGTEPAAHDKAETVKMVDAMGDMGDVSLTDFKVVRIDKDAAVVIYDSEDKSGKDHNSSVWVNRGGKWVAIFHEDGPVRPPMPQPANANVTRNTNASANANKPAPAASPFATTADAEANEKAVWDAIKRGDSDGFASMLADDAMEVEADGVYTKTQSVSSVPTLAFLKTATLSDFKTMRVDDDATIVMYTVKGMGPDHKPFNDHHATVWANRGGKWLAVFHHGTPVGAAMPPPPAAANANKSANANTNANK